MEAFPVLTVADLARLLRIHRSTVYRMLRNKELPAFRVGSDWRFKHDQIDSWMKEQSRDGGEVPRLAHNQKDAGSNPAPATEFTADDEADTE